MHQLIGTGTGDPKHCGNFCHGEHQRKLIKACVPTFPTRWSHGLQHLRHKRPTFAFMRESGYTLGFRRRIAHSGPHAETRAFRTGPLSLPSTRTARSQTSPGRVSERRTLPLLGLGLVCTRRTQKAFGTTMRLCASLSRGVAAHWAALLCLQFGDVAVFFTLRAGLSTHAKEGVVSLPSVRFACCRNAGRPLAKTAHLPFSEVGWLSLISAVQNVSRFLQKQ